MLWPSTVLLSSSFSSSVDAYIPTGCATDVTVPHADALLRFSISKNKAFDSYRAVESVGIALRLWIVGFVCAVAFSCSLSLSLYPCVCMHELECAIASVVAVLLFAACIDWRIKAYHNCVCCWNSSMCLWRTFWPHTLSYAISFMQWEECRAFFCFSHSLRMPISEYDLAANSISRVLCVGFISSNLSVIAGTNVLRIIKVNSKTLWIIHVDIALNHISIMFWRVWQTWPWLSFWRNREREWVSRIHRIRVYFERQPQVIQTKNKELFLA